MSNIHLTTYMGDFLTESVVLILAKKVTNNSLKFP